MKIDHTLASEDEIVTGAQQSLNQRPTGALQYAVDYPFESMEEFSEFMEKADISEEDRRKICWENAERLFL